MRRTNYVAPPFEGRFGAVFDAAVAPHLARPLVAAGAALVALALAAAIETHRVAALDAALAIVTAQSAAAASAASRVTALEAEVVRLRGIDTALRHARRAAAQRVNDLAILGNHLPARTWLTAVRTGRDGSWSIEGRSAALVEIGTALSGLQALDPAAPVRLVSVATTGRRARTLRFTIAWERRP